jgi:hypothetical protein
VLHGVRSTTSACPPRYCTALLCCRAIIPRHCFESTVRSGPTLGRTERQHGGMLPPARFGHRLVHDWEARQQEALLPCMLTLPGCCVNHCMFQACASSTAGHHQLISFWNLCVLILLSADPLCCNWPCTHFDCSGIAGDVSSCSQIRPDHPRLRMLPSINQLAEGSDDPTVKALAGTAALLLGGAGWQDSSFTEYSISRVIHRLEGAEGAEAERVEPALSTLKHLRDVSHRLNFMLAFVPLVLVEQACPLLVSDPYLNPCMTC